MQFLGRSVMLTTLDPLPRPFRAVPGVLAINYRELTELESDNGETFKMLADIVRAEDAAELRQIGFYKRWKVKRRRR